MAIETDQHGTTSITWENDQGDISVDASVQFTVEPRQKQTWEEPGYSGGVVDVGFEVTKIRLHGPGDVLLEISSKTVPMKVWAEALQIMYEDRKSGLYKDFQERVEEACLEALPEPDPDRYRD